MTIITTFAVDTENVGSEFTVDGIVYPSVEFTGNRPIVHTTTDKSVQWTKYPRANFEPVNS